MAQFDDITRHRRHCGWVCSKNKRKRIQENEKKKKGNGNAYINSPSSHAPGQSMNDCRANDGCEGWFVHSFIPMVPYGTSNVFYRVLSLICSNPLLPLPSTTLCPGTFPGLSSRLLSWFEIRTASAATCLATECRQLVSIQVDSMHLKGTGDGSRTPYVYYWFRLPGLLEFANCGPCCEERDGSRLRSRWQEVAIPRIM